MNLARKLSQYEDYAQLVLKPSTNQFRVLTTKIEAFSTKVDYQMQRICPYSRFTYYNDSKATNRNATWFSLTQCYAPVIWIAGSHQMLDEYHFDMPEFREHFKKMRAIIVLEHEAGRVKCWDRLNKYVNVIVHSSKENLFHYIYRLAHAGDIVLFSPACPSFDLFDNYIARGDWFTSEALKCE